MSRTNGPIKVWSRTDTTPTDPEGGYAGGDSTAAAISKVVTDAKAVVDAKFTVGKNLVSTVPAASWGPQSYWTEGADLSPNTDATWAAYTATKPFPITPGTTYTGTRVATAHFLDAAGARIPGAWTRNTNWNNPITVTAPASATHMAITYPTAQAGVVQVEQGSVATGYAPYSTIIAGLTSPNGEPYVTVSDLSTAFPAHTYIDVWTSPVFDDGKNVYVPGQPAGLTTAAAAAAKGDTTLTVAATGVPPGISYVTVPTTADGQVIRVTSVAGGVLTLAAPLAHPIANGQRIDPLWQNASHLGAASNPALPGYAALARYIFETMADTITNPGKMTLLANSWGVQGAGSFAAQAATTYPGSTFVNAAVGGNTTAALLARFDTDVPADTDTLIIFESVNDTYQGIDAATQAAQWRTLVEKGHAIGARVVVIGPPPLNEYEQQSADQENAATARAGTSVRVLQLERAVAALQAQIGG